MDEEVQVFQEQLKDDEDEVVELQLDEHHSQDEVLDELDFQYEMILDEVEDEVLVQHDRLPIQLQIPQVIDEMVQPILSLVHLLHMLDEVVVEGIMYDHTMI